MKSFKNNWMLIAGAIVVVIFLMAAIRLIVSREKEDAATTEATAIATEDTTMVSIEYASGLPCPPAANKGGFMIIISEVDNPALEEDTTQVYGGILDTKYEKEVILDPNLEYYIGLKRGEGITIDFKLANQQDIWNPVVVYDCTTVQWIKVQSTIITFFVTEE